MRKSASWMSVWDDRILEWMVEVGDGDAAPRELDSDDRIKVSKPQIVRRLQRLEEHGLVRKEGRGRYLITKFGREYLDGETEAGKYDEETAC